MFILLRQMHGLTGSNDDWLTFWWACLHGQCLSSPLIVLNLSCPLIGKENVVQVITKNGSNFVLGGKLMEEKKPHIYWTPCVAHCN